MMTGEFAKAGTAADEVVKNALAGIDECDARALRRQKDVGAARFAKWDEMLQVPQPNAK